MMDRLKGWLFLGGLLVGSILPAVSFSQIYKYQDEKGNWHYADRPPAGQDAEQIGKPQKETDAVSQDLAADLLDKYQPGSAVERASLAVVAVKSRLSEGSGFFCSSDGYILTNKHVVKPAETEQWKKLEQAVERNKAAYDAAKRELERHGARLDELEKELAHYQDLVDRAQDDYSKQVAETEYRYLKQRYDGYQEKYDYALARYKASRRAFDKARSEFNWQSSAAVLDRRFKVFLKGDTELSARLIAVSGKHDLALLKVDGYKTPFLKSLRHGRISQGRKVFALGNPLGLRDSVTAGVITSIKDEYLMTDAKVLPGSSGGPLVTDEGIVLGINSLKLTQKGDAGASGFGAAIPIATARDEFGAVVQ